MKYRVLIWGAGGGYNRYLNFIKIHELNGDIVVVGVFADSKVEGKTEIDGYPFFDKSSIKKLDYDYCIVTMDDFKSILGEAMSLGISRDRIIPARVMTIPFFGFDDYICVKKAGISIISSNCFGGLCSHYFAFEFLSPTINMFFADAEFNRFIENIDYYLSCPVKYYGKQYERNLKREYPVGLIDDIHLHFNHATEFEVAVSDWERRKQRIVDNRLYISCTSNREVALGFSRLPFPNKVVFVPKEMNIESDSIIPVDYDNNSSKSSLGMYINDIASGKLCIISLFDLLCKQPHNRELLRIN